ncbi:MAG: O-methyltransferase [Nocardioidaceae bacterium]
MANTTMGITEDLHTYVVNVGVREPDVLQRLRAETSALDNHEMQIAPEQGALLAMLTELTGARRCLEVGTFTGYSSTAVGLAMPSDGTMVCCDVSTEWTDVARRYWAEAGLADRVDLRIGPGVETLDTLLAGGEGATYDFAFVDADKSSYGAYYDRVLELTRPGGLIVFDNTLRGGEVLDPDPADEGTRAVKALNERLHDDERVSSAMLPIADGVTLVRKR